MGGQGAMIKALSDVGCVEEGGLSVLMLISVWSQHVVSLIAFYSYLPQPVRAPSRLYLDIFDAAMASITDASIGAPWKFIPKT